MHHPTRSPSYAQLTRREAVSLASLVLLSSVPTLPVLALDGGVTAETARAQSEAIGVEAAGGLARCIHSRSNFGGAGAGVLLASGGVSARRMTSSRHRA